MALRKCNIVAYKTSDGRKFIGGESKQAANNHEKEIQDFLKEFRNTQRVFEICGYEEQLGEIDEDKILEHFSEMTQDDSDNGIRDLFEDIVECEMDKMLQSTQCASELQDIDEMLDMICYVIDDLGGIESVVGLYNYHKKKGIKS